MLFKLSNLNSNLALTLGYLNPALNNSAQMFIIKLRNWIIPFKLVRLLVTHDGRKLTRAGEFSLA